MKIGILGAGQLAMMLADAGKRLGDSFTFLDPNPESCAARSGKLILAEYTDTKALQRLASNTDVATFEFENVAVEAVMQLQQQVAVHPAMSALSVCQDRLTEKKLLQQLKIPLAEFAEINSRIDLLEAIEQIGYPAVLKTRRMGYDGKGQAVLEGAEDLERAWHKLADYPLVLEAFVEFEAECSILAARDPGGNMVYWPLNQNKHLQGVLAVSMSPSFSESLQQQAEALVARLLKHFNYIGVITLELFLKDGQLLANEIAPRVHNSGHLTIEGSSCSQFENHIRALSGRELKNPISKGVSLMLNWVGDIPEHGKLASYEGVYLHDYGKQPRAGRKLGHTTLVAADRKSLLQLFDQFCEFDNPAIAAARIVLNKLHG